MIRLKNVSVDYAVPGQIIHALRCVDLALPAKGIVVVSGASGSGKTTLLRLLRGDLQPTRGEVHIGGEPTGGWNGARRASWKRAVAETAAVLPFPENTVGDNMVLCARSAGKTKKAAGEQTVAVLRLLGMEDLARSLPDEISGEEQCLAKLGCALVRDSAVLLCDEPFRDLGEKAAESILSLLQTEAERRLVVIFTSDELLTEEEDVLQIRLVDGQVETVQGKESEKSARNGAPVRRMGGGLSGFLLWHGLGRGKQVPVRLLAAFLAVGLMILVLGNGQKTEDAMTCKEKQILSSYPVAVTSADVPSGNLNALADWLDGRVQGTEVYRLYDIQPTVWSFASSGEVRQIQPSVDGTKPWTELFASGDSLSARYELKSGRYPTEYNEVVVILSPDGTMDASCLRALGLEDSVQTVSAVDVLRLTMRLVIPTELYARGADGCWSYMGGDSEYMSSMVRASEPVSVVGIVQPIGEEAKSVSSGGVGYLHALSEYVREAVDGAQIVAEQQANPDTDVTTGLPFDTVGAFSTDRTHQRELLIRLADGMTSAQAISFYRTLTGESAAETEVSGLLHTYFNTLDGNELSSAFSQYVSSSYSSATLEENLAAFGCSGADTLREIRLYGESFAARQSAVSLLGSYSEIVTAEDDASVLSEAGAELFAMEAQNAREMLILIGAIAACMTWLVMFLSVRTRREENRHLTRLGIPQGTLHRVRGGECFLLGAAGGLLGALCGMIVLHFIGGDYTKILLPGACTVIAEAVLACFGGLV